MSLTWQIMAIVQELDGCVYQVQVLSCLFYNPELSNRVGETTMNSFCFLVEDYVQINRAK